MKNKRKKFAVVEAKGAYSGSLLVIRKLMNAEEAMMLTSTPMMRVEGLQLVSSPFFG